MTVCNTGISITFFKYQFQSLHFWYLSHQ